MERCQVLPAGWAVSRTTIQRSSRPARPVVCRTGRPRSGTGPAVRTPASKAAGPAADADAVAGRAAGPAEAGANRAVPPVAGAAAGEPPAGAPAGMAVRGQRTGGVEP